MSMQQRPYFSTMAWETGPGRFTAAVSGSLSGRPEWAIFRLLGGCLLWAVFLSYREKGKLFGYFFTVQDSFWQKAGWATFWVTFFTNSSGHTVPHSDGRDVPTYAISRYGRSIADEHEASSVNLGVLFQTFFANAFVSPFQHTNNAH
jgi:hypothetical protein